jgi:hypothetical protein
VALGLGASLAAAGCGRYGPPVRAEEYQKQQEAADQAAQERRRAKKPSPESTNEPIPSLP